MARSAHVADVSVFDGRSVRERQGVLFATEGIEWVGAHARDPKGVGAAREVDGAGKTLMPRLIDVHAHLRFDGSAASSRSRGSSRHRVKRRSGPW
ncbi:MAG TPA: hypothetical protein VE522_06250 [Actinomycetota bacterium]|jgi:imidazolonepropionase-like amidohydrolase|nr:hypothetical protein [Actinomycetota bacterium]